MIPKHQKKRQRIFRKKKQQESCRRVVNYDEPSTSFQQEVNQCKGRKITSTVQQPVEKEDESIPENAQIIDTEMGVNNIERAIEQVIANSVVFLETDSEEEPIDEVPIMWNSVTGVHLKKITFSENDLGIRNFGYDYYRKNPYEFFKMLITDEIFELFVTETNRYAA
ncbi:hypothetical protein JTB14_016041 [Gonioctena quinquepunctata]|nr:hypothetical protein JTB14_016041 [Gonioctena quinquepunctata]